MKTFLKLTTLTMASFIFIKSSLGTDLRSYKKQKHAKDTPVVTKENCPEEFKKDCLSKCASGDTACVTSCDDPNKAKQFCEDRESRRTEKKLALVAKGASLGAGAVAMIFDDKMGEVSANGTVPVSPYAIFWNRPSFRAKTGWGLIGAGPAGIIPTTLTFRNGFFGFGANVDYLYDSGENFIESDIGPAFYLGSAHMLVGFHPSLLVSAGNGVKPEYGFGLRSMNYYMYEQMFFEFNPMLGYINSQWAYDLKIEAGYRFTPQFFASLGYSFRDILNLNDLDVSNASLQGFFFTLGYRMN
jgi:hypothetical protein